MGTTSPNGDLTSGAQIRIHGSKEREWRAGAFHLVRFTLAADEFFTWNEIVQASNWTPQEVAALIEDDKRRYGRSGHKRWRLRHNPIPLSKVPKVGTTGFEDAETEQWWPLDIRLRRRGGVLLRPNDPKRKGAKIERRRFCSVPVNQEHNCYEPWLPPGERRPRYLYETYEDALADARYADFKTTMKGNLNDQGAQFSTRRHDIAQSAECEGTGGKELDEGYVAITLEIDDSKSLQFGNAGHVLETICKGGRVLSSFPWRPDHGGGDGYDLVDPMPKPPGKLAQGAGQQRGGQRFRHRTKRGRPFDRHALIGSHHHRRTRTTISSDARPITVASRQDDTP